MTGRVLDDLRDAELEMVDARRDAATAVARASAALQAHAELLGAAAKIATARVIGDSAGLQERAAQIDREAAAALSEADISARADRVSLGRVAMAQERLRGAQAAVALAEV